MSDLTYLLDIAFISFVLFVAFFIGLVYYIRREDRREGYPLEDEQSGRREAAGSFISVPKPKAYPQGFDRGVRYSPDLSRKERDLPIKRLSPLPGSPYTPVGDPMTAGVGPGSWTPRPKEPDLDHNGQPKIVPMRVASEFQVIKGDSDPRGMTVVGADGAPAGEITDIWVDRPESLIRYLEATLRDTQQKVLIPITQAVVRGRRGLVVVDAINSDQFKGVPALSNPSQITLDEEERICAYYGAGYLYANPSRMEPVA